MAITIRPASPADSEAGGPILYRAFKTLADHHRFAPDFASPEIAHGVIGSLLSHPKFYGVVAEDDGRIIGSNFVDLRSPIAGIGPISVDPEVQNRGVGRQLMQAVMDEAARRNCPGT
jgi:predicted N-acetyltransferase YhbS